MYNLKYDALPEEARKVFDEIKAKQPMSNTDPHFQDLQESFTLRRLYIEHFGFPLITEEVLEEIKEKFKGLGIKTFIELQAGTGYLTTLLTSGGFAGKGYTLPITPDKKHWGMSPVSHYKKALRQGILVHKKIQGLKVPESDIVISSWIPYKGGDEVIRFFDKNFLPEYYMVIGEGQGGCTANNRFFGWLAKNFKEIDSINSYRPFYAIYDNILIYRRKYERTYTNRSRATGNRGYIKGGAGRKR